MPPLAARMATGELRQGDAARAAQDLLSGMIGMVVRRQILRDPAILRYSQDELVATLVDLTLEGFVPRAAMME